MADNRVVSVVGFGGTGGFGGLVGGVLLLLLLCKISACGSLNAVLGLVARQAQATWRCKRSKNAIIVFRFCCFFCTMMPTVRMLRICALAAI